MRVYKKVISLVMMSILLLCSCQQNEIANGEPTSDISIEESLDQADSKEVKEIHEASGQESNQMQEKATGYEIKTLLPENPVGEMYYWVFLQKGRKTVRQSQVQEINHRLHDLGLEASVGFHIVEMDEYVTPEVLEEVRKQLKGQMDYVSIGSNLCGFDMDEWKESFFELSEELQNGKLNQFYTTVPEKVWEANQIDNGIYSFSNSTTVQVLGYKYSEKTVAKYGEEMLHRITDANGVENEEIWREIYENKNEPVCLWGGLYTGIPICISENPYERRRLGAFANDYEKQYFSFFTEDIRYNLETEKFEWLIESEKYIELKDTVEDFYKKGYLDVFKRNQLGEQDGMCPLSNTTTISELKISNGKKMSGIWVPAWKQSRVSRYESNRSYMYSFVYKDAKAGWEAALNLMGSNQEISHILNQDWCDVTIAATVYEEPSVHYVPDIDDQYEMMKLVYEEAEPDPLAGFIFNPVPIKEEWEEYNRLMASYEKTRITLEASKEGDPINPNFEAIDIIWKGYQDMKEKAHIELVLEEVSRQYVDWKTKG